MPYNAATRAANLEAARSAETKAGWSIREFCASIGISVAKFYLLSTDLKPRSVKLAGRVVISEAPREYLARMQLAQQGGA
jgi:ribonuclease PH